MKYSIHDVDTNEVILDMIYPVGFHTGQKVESRNILFNKDDLDINYSQQWFDGMMLNFGDFYSEKHRRFLAKTDTPTIEMRFALQGDTNALLGYQQTNFRSGHHQIFYSGEHDGKYSHSHHSAVFEVELTEQYFNRLVNDDCELLARMGEHISKKEFAFMGQQQPITQAMLLVIQDIKNYRQTDDLKRIFIESRILDLLMLQLEQLQRSARPQACLRLKSYDIERIYHAREILEKNISKPCSLIDLAHQVGINEFKLKQGFKEIFGNTVFGFLNDRRMSDARRMLADNTSSVEEVAYYCGFEHSKNFKTAFKKYWGVTPAQLKI